MTDYESFLKIIWTDLPTRFIGQWIIYYPRLTSTMDVARDLAGGGAEEGAVVIADEQVAGKGRLKRAWFTPKGNIALSVILHPHVSLLPCLVMLASLAVAHSIEAVTGLSAEIKWPNDVLINGKKVCGILIESNVRENKVHYAVIGIGINTDLKIVEHPEIPADTTSLASESGADVSRTELIRQLLVEIERLYLKLPGESVYEEWRDRLVTLGKKVRATSGGSILYGVAESVGRDGSLLLRHADGSSTEIIAADVTLRYQK
jgi:BirA family biotin operon repressor/biotin-[acetyl-CoA-carboxylase] ligase